MSSTAAHVGLSMCARSLADGFPDPGCETACATVSSSRANPIFPVPPFTYRGRGSNGEGLMTRRSPIASLTGITLYSAWEQTWPWPFPAACRARIKVAPCCSRPRARSTGRCRTCNARKPLTTLRSMSRRIGCPVPTIGAKPVFLLLTGLGLRLSRRPGVTSAGDTGSGFRHRQHSATATGKGAGGSARRWRAFGRSAHAALPGR